MLARALLPFVAATMLASACAPAVPVRFASPATSPASDEGPPNSARDEWARQRVEAVLQIYGFTEAAAAEVRRMRVYHVAGRPGWFGSTGYEGWIGIGQARPAAVVHEISHSLWGAFPVEGHPELPWKPTQAFAALHRDLKVFLQQPPDSFEPLRERLRRVPDLLQGDYPGLYHLGEADIISLTGGNLNLVPPVLRKYYAAILRPGAFASWAEAIAWYLALPQQERRKVDLYFGVGSVLSGEYPVTAGAAAQVRTDVAAVVEQEERQRLVDFAQQFDLYSQALDAEGAVASRFHFWRDYLRDTMFVYRDRPDTLRSGEEGSLRTSKAFDFLLEIRGLRPEERPGAAAARLAADPFLLHFTSTLEHATLAKLLEEGAVGPALRRALHPSHARLLDAARRIQQQSGAGAEAGARALNGLVRTLKRMGISDVNFTLDVVNAVNGSAMDTLLASISRETALLLMKEDPAFVRSLLAPEPLMAVLGLKDTTSPAKVAALARLLTSRMEMRPLSTDRHLEAVYRRVAELAQRDPRAALAVFRDTRLYLEPFLVQHPRDAARMLAADVSLAAGVLLQADPVRLPPARAIYRVVRSDPALAARLTAEYDRRGEAGTVTGALVFFAYDAPRLRAQPSLPLSLESDARYLLALAELKGESWLRQGLADAVQRYQQMIDAGEMDPAFLDTYRETLAASLATLPAGAASDQLALALKEAGLGRSSQCFIA